MDLLELLFLLHRKIKAERLIVYNLCLFDLRRLFVRTPQKAEGTSVCQDMFILRGAAM